MSSGDSYKRRSTGPDTYQCGCEWKEGLLVQCPLHHQATVASVDRFERERSKPTQQGATNA